MLNTRTESTTTRTGLRSIGRVDIFYRNSRPSGLVLDEGLKLRKGPTVEISALSPSLPGVLSDMRQLFHHNAVSCLQTIYDCSANAVIQVAHNASLLTLKAFGEAMTASAPFGLKTCTQLAIVLPNVHRLLSFESKSITGNGKINHTDINADFLTRLGGWINFLFHDNMHVKHLGLLIVNKIRRAVDTPLIEDGTLKLTQDHRHLDAPLDGRNGRAPVLSDRKCSTIKTNSGIRAETARSVLFAFPVLVRLGNLVSRGAGKLGWKAKLLTGGVVDKMMKGNFIRHSPMLISNSGNVVASIAEQVDGFKHRHSLYVARSQLATYGLCQFWHNDHIIDPIGGEFKG